jgi:hypothetical protein
MSKPIMAEITITPNPVKTKGTVTIKITAEDAGKIYAGDSMHAGEKVGLI